MNPTNQVTALRIMIADHYETTRRDLDIQVESEILKAYESNDQQKIDQLNQRRDVQIKLLKQDEDDAFASLNYISNSNKELVDIIKWRYFVISVDEKIYLVQTDFFLTPEQISTYKQFLEAKECNPEYLSKLIDAFDLKIANMVDGGWGIYKLCLFDERTVVQMDTNTPLFRVNTLYLKIGTSYENQIFRVDRFEDSPAAKFILRHVQNVEIVFYHSEWTSHEFSEFFDILMQLDKLFDSFRSSADQSKPSTIDLTITDCFFDRDADNSYWEWIARQTPSLPDYKYKCVSRLKFSMDHRGVDILRYCYGNMTSLQSLEITLQVYSNLTQPLFFSKNPSVKNLALNLFIRKERREESATYHIDIDIEQLLNNSLDLVSYLSIINLGEMLTFVLINTRRIHDLPNLVEMLLHSEGEIKTDFNGPELSVLTLDQLKTIASSWKGLSASQSNLSINTFIIRPFKVRDDSIGK